MIVANEILLPEVIALLEGGTEVILRAKGRSMMPYIRSGSDSLVLVKANRTALKVGDVVLALVGRNNYVVHRIKCITGDTITLKGDGNFRKTECCHRDNVHGLLVAVVKNGRRVDCCCRSERIKAWVYRRLWWPRLFAGACFRKLIGMR